MLSETKNNHKCRKALLGSKKISLEEPSVQGPEIFFSDFNKILRI